MHTFYFFRDFWEIYWALDFGIVIWKALQNVSETDGV